jgi:hypothetical protein
MQHGLLLRGSSPNQTVGPSRAALPSATSSQRVANCDRMPRKPPSNGQVALLLISRLMSSFAFAQHYYRAL